MGNSCGRLEAHNTGWATTCSLASSTDGLAGPFLEGIGLGVYAVAFKVAGFDTQQQLSCLTEQDLDKVQWQSHIPILPAHRQRILEASRCHPALQVELPTIQQHTLAGTAAAAAAAAACSVIVKEDRDKETPEAAAVAAPATQTTAAEAAATAGQAVSGAFNSPTTASTAAGCAAIPHQELHAGQGVRVGRATQLVAPGLELEHAQHAADDGAAACSGVSALPQLVQAHVAPHCNNGAHAGNAPAGEPAAASPEASTAEVRATVTRLLQKLQLACVPCTASQPTAAQEPAATAAAGTPGTARGQAAAGDAQHQQERQQEGQLAVRVAATAEALAAADSASKQQPSSEIMDSYEAAAATTAPAATAAAAAASPREAGPLMAHKAALLHSSSLSADVQRRPAPTAWMQLPRAVASQAYASKPPRSVQSRVHVASAHQDAHVNAAEQLQGEASSTAVTAAAALQAQRSLLAAAAALAEPAAARQQAGGIFVKHQQQLACGSASDAEYKPQDQWWLQYAPSAQASAAGSSANAAAAAAASAAAGDVPALCASVSPVSKSSSSRASSRQRGPAAAESLECSSVITGSVVVGVLSGSTPAAAGCSEINPASAAVESAASVCVQQHAAVPTAPYNLWSTSDWLPSPERLLQQADRQQLTASLVRQLSNSHSSSSRAAAAASTCRAAAHGHATSARHGAAHASSAGARMPCAPASAGSAEHRCTGGYGRTAGIAPEQSLRQCCSANAVLPAAATTEQASALELAKRLTPQHSQLTVELSRASVMSGSSMAGSMAGERPNSSRPGSRASDVRSIVSRAKERSAARQRLSGRTATPLDSSSSSLTLLSPRQLQQQLAAASLDASMAGSDTDVVSCSSRGVAPKGQAAAARTVTCGVAGGEQAMRMLQDYRAMAELDAAIKARVSQLSSSSIVDTPGKDRAAAGRYSSAAGVAAAVGRPGGAVGAVGRPGGALAAVGRPGGALAAVGRPGGALAAVGRPGGAVGVAATAAARQAAGGTWGGAAAAHLPEADTANRSDCSPDRQLRQQHRRWSGPVDARAVADGSVVVGLLGICEALDNSYDAGRPPAAAATAIGRTSAGGYGSSSSWGGRSAYGKRAQPDAGYRNPFLSPSPTESPTPDVAGGAGGGRDAGRSYAQHQNDVNTTASAWAGGLSGAGSGGGGVKAWSGSAGMAAN